MKIPLIFLAGPPQQTALQMQLSVTEWLSDKVKPLVKWPSFGVSPLAVTI